MAITKTDFMRGMQCRKMLWLDKHKPGLRVIPPEVQERLDAATWRWVCSARTRK